MLVLRDLAEWLTPTDTGVVCHQRHLWQVRPLRGHSPRPGPHAGPAALPALLPDRSHPCDQTFWATHALSPFPTHKDGQVILGLVPGGRQFSSYPRNTCGGGTPPTQRLRVHHGGAGDHGGWRSLSPCPSRGFTWQRPLIPGPVGWLQGIWGSDVQGWRRGRSKFQSTVLSELGALMDLQNGKIGHRGPGYRLSEGDLKRRGRREECHEDLGSDAHLLVLSLGGTGFCT